MSAPVYNTGVKHKERMDGDRTVKMGREESRWAIARAAGDLWRTLRADCRAIPRHAWWRWGATLATGFAVCAVLSYLVAILTRDRAEHGLQAWDEHWIAWFADHGPISFQNAILLESGG